MEFARKILQNYGWKEGDGLGKNQNGISKPLKAALKFDKAGFGADQAADDFNNHWWERVFNEATTNVNVSLEGEQVKMSLKDKDSSVEISTKGYSVKKLKKLKKNSGETCAKNSYENFLRVATLTNLGAEVANADKINTHDIDVCKVNVLSDEELFKACGGRTAHKGARHGLKLCGKLARIEQQEEELLAKMMAKRKSFLDDEQSRNDLVNISKGRKDQNQEGIIEHKPKKKKRKHSEKNSNEDETNAEPTIVKKSKKNKVLNKEAEIHPSYDEQPSKNTFLIKDNNEKTRKIENGNSSCLEEKSSRKKKKNKEKFLK